MAFLIRSLIIVSVSAAIAIPLVIVLCNVWVNRAAAGRTYDSVEAIPANKVGVVMGCSKYIANGNPNVYFSYRIQAAVELFNAGKVQYLIVSGDNRRSDYNEPHTMRDALVEAGVPKDRIVCDYAGFRTLDTVVRAKKVFLEDSFTIISQRSHNQRAVFLASRYAVDAVAFNASRVSIRAGFKTKVREALARVKAVMDVTVLNKQPKFLGDTIPIGG